MILTVTPNPSVDRSLIIHDYHLGEIHRPERVVVVAGGKGLNVARTIKLLGGSCAVCTVLAGYNGRWIFDQLEQAGISVRAVWSPGETRTCTTIIDPHASQITDIYENGAPIDAHTWEAFEETYSKFMSSASWITFSGSLPPGAPLDGYARLLHIANSQTISTIMDVQGEPLRLALTCFPDWIKINASEIGAATHVEVKEPSSAVQAAKKLFKLGARNVVVTLGLHGAVAVATEGIWYAKPPLIKALAPVGSGDAFLGGFVLALSKRLSIPEALTAGVATGSANTLEVGQAIFDPGMVLRIAAQVEISPLSPE